MIGRNTMSLNTATMIEAMQEYLDKRMGEHAPRVMNVEADSRGMGSSFKIETEGKEVPA